MSDVSWNNVKLLMHCDGIDNSIKFVDERHHVFTKVGNTCLKSLQKKFGGTSLYFDGAGDYGSFSASSDFNIGEANFTMEFFVFPRETTNANPIVFAVGTPGAVNAIWLTVDGSGNALKYDFFAGNSSTMMPLLVSTSNVVYDQWAHIRITRSADAWYLFVDGVLECTANYTGSATNASSAIYIGGTAVTDNQYFGYLDEIRLTVGVARSTADFTVPTALFENGDPDFDVNYDKVQLHLHCDGESGGTSFIDQKGHSVTRGSNIVTVTNDSVFGGSCINTAGYLEVPYSDDFNVGAGDFTLEVWSKLQTAIDNQTYRFIEFMQQGSTNRALCLAYSSSSGWPGVVYPNVNTGTDGFVNWQGAGSVGTAWAFLSLTRLGNMLYLHQNGTLTLTRTIGTDLSLVSAPYRFRVGLLSAANYLIDEIRFTKGLARYTSANYIKPAEPFPHFFLQRLTGTIRDSDGNPISRTARSYRASDGLRIDSTVSDPATGAFSLRATDLSEHFVVVHDPVKNALVYDHIVPVI